MPSIIICTLLLFCAGSPGAFAAPARQGTQVGDLLLYAKRNEVQLGRNLAFTLLGPGVEIVSAKSAAQQIHILSGTVKAMQNATTHLWSAQIAGPVHYRLQRSASQGGGTVEGEAGSAAYSQQKHLFTLQNGVTIQFSLPGSQSKPDLLHVSTLHFSTITRGAIVADSTLKAAYASLTFEPAAKNAFGSLRMQLTRFQHIVFYPQKELRIFGAYTDCAFQNTAHNVEGIIQSPDTDISLVSGSRSVHAAGALHTWVQWGKPNGEIRRVTADSKGMLWDIDAKQLLLTGGVFCSWSDPAQFEEPVHAEAEQLSVILSRPMDLTMQGSSKLSNISAVLAQKQTDTKLPAAAGMKVSMTHFASAIYKEGRFMNMQGKQMIVDFSLPAKNAAGELQCSSLEGTFTQNRGWSALTASGSVHFQFALKTADSQLSSHSQSKRNTIQLHGNAHSILLQNIADAASASKSRLLLTADGPGAMEVLLPGLSHPVVYKGEAHDSVTLHFRTQILDLNSPQQTATIKFTPDDATPQAKPLSKEKK